MKGALGALWDLSGSSSQLRVFAEFTRCQCILPSVAALLDHVRGSGEQGLVDGYLIHLHCYQSSEPTNAFWSLQASIIGQMHIIQKLRLFVAFVHPDHDGRSVFKFVTQLSKSGWVISSMKCYYSDYGFSCRDNDYHCWRSHEHPGHGG